LRQTRVLAIVVVVFAGVGVTVACGLDAVGTGPADNASEGGPLGTGNPGSSLDAAGTSPGLEGGNIPVGGDAGPSPNLDAAIDSPLAVVDAAPDGAIVYVCPTGDTTDCSKCGGGRTLGCVMCANSGPGIYAVCTPPGVSCYASYRPSGYTWCRCPSSPSECKLPTQGCNSYDNGVCVTCGESSTDGDPCKGGGKCNQSAKKCE
jgi:hypothetical protein